MKTILLVIIFGLLMSNIANAQCAWVLWEEKKELLDSTGSWTLQEAFPDYGSCMVASEHYENENAKVLCANILPKKSGSMQKEDDSKLRDCSLIGSTLFASKFKGSKYLYTLMFTYKCLPDTIDPRK